MYNDWCNSFRNITETRHPIRLTTIKGSVPKKIKGRYFKINPADISDNINHPYDGNGLISCFSFEDGEVYYKSKYVDTKHKIMEDKFGIRLFQGAFGTKGLLPLIKNPGNTTVISWNKELLVFSESGIPYRIDIDTLETKGSILNFKEGLPYRSNNSILNKILYNIGIFGDNICAHPKNYEDRLILYKIDHLNNDSSMITFYEIDTDMNILSIKKHKINSRLYFVHDFIVTKNYYVIVQPPLDINLNKIGDGVVNALSENKDKTNIVHVIPRSKEYKSYECELLNGFITHHFNIPQTDIWNRFIDVFSIIYPNMLDWNNMGNDNNKSEIYKTEIDTHTGFTSQRVVLNKSVEFPVYDVDKQTIYAIDYSDAIGINNIIKINMKEYNDKGMLFDYDIWKPAYKLFYGEPVIVDDYILTTCYNPSMKCSYLYIFSKDISAGPISISKIPVNLPVGLHGCWLGE